MAEMLLDDLIDQIGLLYQVGIRIVVVHGGGEQATALGEAMMEEVLARPFFEPGQTAPTLGPDGSESNRQQFKSIDDFASFSESVGNLGDFQDNAISDTSVAGFLRTVSIQYVTFPNQDPSDVNGFMRIQVKVYRDSVLLVTLDRIVSRED